MLLFRYACFVAMSALALWNEMRPGAPLRDVVLERLPYVAWIDDWNHWAWLFLYLPLSLCLLVTEPRAWLRYMIAGGIVSLARGVAIVLTNFGPPATQRAGPGIGDRDYLQALVEIISPIDVFGHGSMKAYLTQDLFFSGHAATTFLLVLYLWRKPTLRWFAVAAHVAMVLAVLLAHLHYTVDIVGAWIVTYAVFRAVEHRVR
ncbi:MAG: phosphatase PAP2 family protein [Planctomycetes bacterium]|nr:phosphatase PAP2 family protein [Planctomycetota bacterium]